MHFSGLLKRMPLVEPSYTGLPVIFINNVTKMSDCSCPNASVTVLTKYSSEYQKDHCSCRLFIYAIKILALKEFLVPGYNCKLQLFILPDFQQTS